MADRDLKMHQSEKGTRDSSGRRFTSLWTPDSALMHTACVTAGNVNDMVEADNLLHGKERDVFANASYQDAAKRPYARAGVTWRIAIRPGKR